MSKRSIIYPLLLLGFLVFSLSSCQTNDQIKTSLASQLPLCEEPVTLTCLVNPSEDLLNLCDGDLNNSPFFQELEKRTNVHIEWITSIGELQSQYAFNQSSTPTPDLVQNYYLNNSYGTALDAGVDNGSILNLTELIPKYAPNYYQIVQESDLDSIVYTNSGRLAAVYSIRQTPQGPWGGLQIRKDWLDELGMDIPVTYEDWETVLTAFKEKKGATAPLWIPSSGCMMDNSLSAGFQVTSDFFHIGDTVYYGPAQKGWKEYLTLLRRWYEKGLIDPNFMTGNSLYPEKDMIESGAIGAWFHMYTMPSTFSFAEGSDQAEVVAVAPPKVHVQDEGHIRMQDSYVDSYFTITSSCKHPDIALRWMDYLFSEEGALLANYGLEGETYTLDEEGHPAYTEYMTQNPDGLTFSEAIMSFTYPPGLPSFYVDWQRECQSLPQKDVSMCDIWAQSNDDYLLPTGINFTPEENTRFSAILARLQPYVWEQTVSFITGVSSLEKDYDPYLEKLKELGLDEAEQILQTAYRRYLEKQ